MPVLFGAEVSPLESPLAVEKVRHLTSWLLHLQLPLAALHQQSNEEPLEMGQMMIEKKNNSSGLARAHMWLQCAVRRRC